MRFDNPITDHGFIFPDIANFPDVRNEPRYEKDGTEQIDLMYKAIENNDLELFHNAYKFFIKKIDDELFQKINQMFKFYANFEKNRKEVAIPSNKIYKDLYENGISCLNVDTKELYEMLTPKIEKLLKIPDWFPPPATYDRGEQLDDTYKQYIQNIFTKLGIINAASKYNKGNRILKVTNVFLHISTPTDNVWKQFLYDCKTFTKTTNLHIDPKEDVIKAMIYLNEVQKDNGAFSYIEKSHRYIHDKLQNIFGRAISTGSYCYNPESRAAVFQFPSFLRISYNFGRVLLDDNPQQKKLIEQEKFFINELGNLFVFDPAGMHRGGMCKTGHRIALQILMK